ncbi:MAG: sarcosine oxidase subunit gamma family protein [Chloroflexota bacterium]|jgi:heterotetrameric sarcosine oxidase gamma subunit
MTEGPIKLSPLYNVLRQAGGQFVIQGGWQVFDSLAVIENDPAIDYPGVYLVDESHRGKIMIHGEGGGQAVAALDVLPPQLPGQGVVKDALSVYRLRPDQLFINMPPGAELGIIDRLTNILPTIAQLVTVTEVTHGRFQLRLIGPASPLVLGRLCGMDFHPEQFPNHTARQTAVAKTTQLIIREDIDELISYSIVGARSLAGYLWETMLDSGQDFGIRPAGQQFIRTMKRQNENQSPVNLE